MHLKKLIFSTLLIVFAMSLGCMRYNEEEINSFENKIEAYIKKNKLDGFKKQLSGLYIKTIKEGTEGEEVQSQSVCSITYKGTLLNGKVFDRSHVKRPLEFELKQFIKGFQEALMGKKIGTELELIVPPQLGYGSSELDDIPANSILHFSLRLKKIQ